MRLGRPKLPAEPQILEVASLQDSQGIGLVGRYQEQTAGDVADSGIDNFGMRLRSRNLFWCRPFPLLGHQAPNP